MTDKPFSEKENTDRRKAAKKLAEEKNISILDALEITMNDRYNIDTGIYTGSSNKIKKILKSKSTLLTKGK
jgi:hypothetical protein